MISDGCTIPLSLRRLKEELNSTVQIKVGNVISDGCTIPLSLRRLKEELNSMVQIKVCHVMSLTLMVGTIPLSLKML